MRALIILLLLAVPAAAQENIDTIGSMYLNCNSEGGQTAEDGDRYVSYCYGFLVGHVTALQTAPIPIYCKAGISAGQLADTYRRWYILTGQKFKDENLGANLWKVWLVTGVCEIDQKRFDAENSEEE